MIPKVIQVIPQDNFTVYVYFEDGKIVLYDVTPLLSKGVFTKLQDKNIFMHRCTVMNGTLAWDVTGNNDPVNCIDIDPDTLYSLPKAKEILTA